MQLSSNELMLCVLVGLILVSAFFSGSETALMAVDHRLLGAVRKGDRAALRVQKMLRRPDRLLGVILLGNTFSNLLAPQWLHW